MKVFNLTDVSTPKLQQFSLVNHTFVVASALLAPGASEEIEPKKLVLIRNGLQHLVSVGALAVGDQPPAAYLLAKSHEVVHAPEVVSQQTKRARVGQ